MSKPHRLGLLASALLMTASVSSVDVAVADFPGRDGRIAFTFAGRGDVGGSYLEGVIYAMNGNFAAPAPLIVTGGELDAPVWAPRGDRIAYSRRDEDGTFENIYVADASGGGQTRVTSGPKSEVRPAWSPDGGQLLYTTTTGDSYDALRYFIYVVNTDGTGNTALVSDSVDVLLGPVWSPRSNRIVYTRYVDSNGDIWVMSSNGSGQRPLIHSRLSEDAPDWSPDGRNIVFSRRDRDGTGLNIYTARANGTHVTAVNTRRYTQTDPVWSPNGRYIAYANYDGYEGHTGNYEVCTMTVAGRRVRCTQSEDWEYAPDWQALP